jgi:hypothetical protein
MTHIDDPEIQNLLGLAARLLLDWEAEKHRQSLDQRAP